MHPMMKACVSNFCTIITASLGLTISIATSSLVPVSSARAQSAVAPFPIRSMEARSAFATGIENQLRRAGKDARVQLDGEQREILWIEWQKVSRRDLNTFFNSAIVDSQAELVGLRTIVVTSGAQRWDYDIARQSLVWSPSQQ